MTLTAALHRLRRRLGDERGMALVMAIGVTAVLGATVTSTIAFTSASFRQSSRSAGDQVALSLAEAGLNNGLAQLYASGDPTMADALPAEDAPAEQLFAGVGRAQWYGVLDAANDSWTVYGVGLVANSTSPGAPELRRQVSLRVSLGSGSQGSENNAVWNYVYADAVDRCTTLQNTVNINVPLYVRGDLCMQNSATFTGYALQVGGTVSLTNSATVGSAGAPVQEAHIAGGCRVEGGPLQTPCGAATRVHARISDNRPYGLTKPPVDFDYWYANAKPGPRSGCSAGSFPGGFDNDSLRNSSRADVDLTPTTAYDCRVYDASGNLVGRIAWQPGTPGTLTITGTIFFDGNVTFRNRVDAVYVGRGTIYASGSITLENQTTVCGVAGCGSDWDANNNLLAFVAGRDVSVQNNSTFQGATYAVRDFVQGNSAIVWGPVVADHLYFQNSTQNHYVPIGTLLPGMPAEYEEVVTLRNEAGSWGS